MDHASECLLIFFFKTTANYIAFVSIKVNDTHIQPRSRRFLFFWARPSSRMVFTVLLSDFLAQYLEAIVAEVRIIEGAATTTCFEQERIYSSFP